MTEKDFVNFEDRTYDDLWEAAGVLEQAEPSDNRSIKIYLLLEFCEMNRLRLALNRLKIQKTDLIPQYDQFSFFRSRDLEENDKKIRLLKRRLNRLWKLDMEAREQNSFEKFDFERLHAKYA
jgi:hypothetical protein